jgi:hypothetical protein
VAERRQTWGYNEIEEKKVSPLMMFLAYLWGPMPVMIWVAMIVEFAKVKSFGSFRSEFATSDCTGAELLTAHCAGLRWLWRLGGLCGAAGASIR